MTTLYYESELYHHGIKGMKWGVRRFRNTDGSLTPAGKKRYSDAVVKTVGKAVSKSKHKREAEKASRRNRLEKGYREKGMTDEQAKAAVDRRLKIEKTVMIAGALTMTAATAYYAKNKYMETYCDTILKSGTTFHNLDASANPRPGEHLYVNYRQNDKEFFRSQFALGKMSRSETGNAFDHKIVAKGDVKIPSRKTRQNVFKELYDSDETFRQTIDSHSRKGGSKNAKEAYGKMWQYFGDKDDPKFNDAKHKYFKALQDKGYDAVVDEWDSKKFVYRSDAPLILLNTSSKSLGEMTISELSTADVLKAQANSRGFNNKVMLLNNFMLPHANNFKESESYLKRTAEKAAKNSKYIDKALEAHMPVFEQKAKEHANGMANFRKSVGESITKAEWDEIYNRQLKKQIDDLAFAKKGSNLARVGKVLTKHENMTLSQAKAKVDNIETAEAIAALMGGTTAYSALISAPDYAKRNKYVEDYLKKHPETMKTNKEIEKMYWKEKRGY